MRRETIVQNCFTFYVYLFVLFSRHFTINQRNLGIIHLVRTQNFPKNDYFVPPNTPTYMCVSWGKKC